MLRDVSCAVSAGPQHPASPTAMLPYLLRTISLTSVVFMIAPSAMCRTLISILCKMCLTSFDRVNRFDYRRNIKFLWRTDGPKTRDRGARRPCSGDQDRAVPTARGPRSRGAAGRRDRREARRDALVAVLSPPAARACQPDHPAAVESAADLFRRIRRDERADGLPDRELLRPRHRNMPAGLQPRRHICRTRG